MSSTRSRLRTPALAVVALAASLGLLTQGALVAHADDLAATTAAETSAVESSGVVDDGTATGGAEAVEAPASEPVDEADPGDIVEPVAPAEPVDETVGEEPAGTAGSADPVDEVVQGEPADSLTTPDAAEGSDAVLPLEGTEAVPAAALVGENLPVVTQDDYYVIAPGGTVTVGSPGLLGNDSDPEKDPITTQQGSFTTWLGNTGYIGAHGEFGFTAAPGFLGTDTITYYAQDEGHGGTTGTIYVTVQENTDANENHWPDTATDSYTTPQDQPLSIPSHLGLLANDTDDEGDLITTKAVGPIPTDHGTITIDDDGSFYYVPDAGFIGVDSASYIAFDTFGGGSWGSVIVSVTPPGTTPAGPNAAPIAVADQYTTPVNVPLNVDAAHGALINDSDPEGTALAAWTYNWGQSQMGGTGTVAADGSFIYVAPATAAAGDQDYFGYMVTDEAGLPSYSSISITFTDAVAIVGEPSDPGDGQGTGHGQSGDPSTSGGDPEPTTGGADGETPMPELPNSPIVTASQTIGSTRDDDELASTGVGVWPLIGGSITVLVLGAAGLVIARRRRVGDES
ncbi:Ig-like domain-containing protein [Agreia bicolorata]|uniref:Gram-positive cocci surface proteins LPxTG domain-containing protein n=1 Tax=Agreia bicolorata TaxID=110935 RepID=A0ABR5CFC3_9MICO|nr:Ig-like domain-containing protein [Agreia bicolorata]KJC64353.1 hypothetical protein TZ00_07840 [Agreia bicolorata]